MQRDAPAPVEQVLVRYGASEMPTATIERIQSDTLSQFEDHEIDVATAFRITNLLLGIALLKLNAVTVA